MTTTERANVIWNLIDAHPDPRPTEYEDFIAAVSSVISAAEVEAATAMRDKCARIARSHEAHMTAGVIEEMEVDG